MIDVPEHAAAAVGVGPARAHVWPVTGSLGVHVQVALAAGLFGVQAGLNVGTAEPIENDAFDDPGLPATSDPLTVKV